MPASRPCGEPGCPQLQPCSVHHREPFARRRTAKRVYGAQHRRVRAEVLARDGQRCVDCGSTGDLQLDHVDRRGPTTVENGATRCRRCNLRKAQREARAGRRSPR